MSIEPATRLSGFELLERGEVRRRQATAIVSRLPRHIAERELHEVARLTGWEPDTLEVREVESPGPGNVVLLTVESEAVTEVFVGFGQRGVPAEQVAGQAVRDPLSGHATTQVELIPRFLNVAFQVEGSAVRVTAP